MRNSVVIYFFLFFLAVSLLGGSVLTTYTQFVEDGPLSEAVDVVIPKGKSLKQVARILKREGVIDSPAIFELGVRANGNTYQIKSGEYHFPRRASAKLVMNILTDGQTVARRFIAPEGLTSRQIVELMDKYKGLVGEVTEIPRNGSLLPETYNYSYGDTKESLIRRMQEAMTKTLNEVWKKRNPAIPLKTPYEAVILASVVEKETGRSDERPHIASVFYNRLRKNIKLQSDPTVIYAITEGRLDLKRSLTYKDLKFSSPYNTYVAYGLPEGPIANPGRAALEAVCNPLHTNDLYFVADGTGGHVFAPTYDAHQQNVNEWRRIQKKNKQPKPTAPTPTLPVSETTIEPVAIVPQPESLAEPISQPPIDPIE